MSAPVAIVAGVPMASAMSPACKLPSGLMADAIGTPATIATGALICALAAVVTLNVVRRREAQLAAAQ